MLSGYFKIKTKTKEFEDNLTSIIEDCRGKKVLLYGAGEGFVALDKKYDFKKNINIVAIADKKFETKKVKDFRGIRTITPKCILNEEYDVIVVTNEYTKPILAYLTGELVIKKDIKTIFVENIKDERTNINYLTKHHFERTLPKLVKKLKNKKIMFYGAGCFLEVIKKYYDLSGLNVLGVADKKYGVSCDCEEFLGYKTYSPLDIIDAKPDCVVVSTKYYINICEDLYFGMLNNTKIKLKPLCKKGLLTLIKEIVA